MNINLEYEGKHYNFDIKKDAKIDYLKELSSKLFKSDKTLLELICNNNKIDGNNDNIFIQDLIPKGKNSTVLTVQMNDDIKNNDNSQNKKIINHTNTIKSEELKKKKIELDKNINNTDIDINKNSKNNNINIEINDNDNNKSINQIFENKIFIANYIKKSNELFAMMKDFNDKVKETDNILNKKMKNFDIGFDNNIYYYELSLFEKRLIDFQKRQINYYKELIQILDNNIDEGKETNFDIFYNKILLNNNEYLDKSKEMKNKNNIFPNIGKKNLKLIKKINSPDVSESLNNILPKLSDNNKYKNNILFNDFEKNINNEDNEVFRTINKRKTSKKHNNNIITEKIKIKNIKLNKINIKDDKINNDNFSEDKEIKYNSDINDKIKIERNTNKNNTKKI